MIGGQFWGMSEEKKLGCPDMIPAHQRTRRQP